MPHEETVTASYIVAVGNPDLTHSGSLVPFVFQVEAPASLCKPHYDHDAGQNTDANGVFMASLVDRYHPQILNSRSWQCISCNKPAKEIFHSTIALLSPNLDRMQPQFTPSVFDIAAPICFSSGNCDRIAGRIIHKFQSDAMAQNQMPEESKTCDTCGRKSGIKVCGGCKTTGYCSKECQTKAWPNHAKPCKRAQRERSAESFMAYLARESS